MTVERGADWGHTGPLPESTLIATSDAAASRHLRNLLDPDRSAEMIAVPEEGQTFGPVALSGGDLRQTLGGRRTRGQLRTLEELAHARCDFGIATTDKTSVPFVAHVVARRPFWRGTTNAVMNAAFHGAWNVAPKAHPGDGRFDVLEASLGLSDRLKARRRLPSGDHVPHPKIIQRRLTTASITFDRPTEVFVDHVSIGRANRLEVVLVPDALHVVV